jgi:DNA-binding NarL/FixJ family response regulator
MRAIIADGEPTVRYALRDLLTQGLDMQVVGEADAALALQREVQQHKPDLVIVAWNLVVTDAKSVLAGLRDSSPGLRVVVLGLRPETRHVALKAGADEFISKVDAPEFVVRVLRGPQEKESLPEAARPSAARTVCDQSTSRGVAS